MSYILESSLEAERLEKQALQKNYSIESELKCIDIRDGMSVLDAGCGTGVLSRYLCDNNSIDSYACDNSVLRLEQAKKLSDGYDINYFESDLNEIDLSKGNVDFVVCRYVFEYLSNPVSVCCEFKRILSDDGKVCLIDLDGVFANIYSGDIELESMLELLRVGVPNLDVYVGRKLPSFLVSAGFHDVRWDVSVEVFQGDELELEIENSAQRIEQAMPLIDEVFGARSSEFCERYMRALRVRGATLFMNKFIVTGRK